MAERIELTCAIARSLDVLGEKWSLLVIREALSGTTRFSEFQESLGVSTDILAARLARLVEEGVLERRAYREAGARERFSYHPTPTGEDLRIVLAALAMWGNDHRQGPLGPTPVYRDSRDHEPVRVGFVSGDGRLVAPELVDVTRAAASTAAR